MRVQGRVGEEREVADDKASLLFETKEVKWRGAYRVFAYTILAGICIIWWYRIRKILFAGGGGGRRSWVDIGVMWSEICVGMFWILTQSVRWTILHHSPFKHILSRRYGEEKLPGVDIFVCTADPKLEPPSMVMNTVLSAMSYNYPSRKLSVYLSDDGGSELTFYALLRASLFSKHWIPFCRRFNIQTRSPQAYFSQHSNDGPVHKKWSSMKKLYEDMKSEIESVVEKGKIPDSVRKQHSGFSQWNAITTKQNHQPIVQIMIDGRDPNAIDDDGFQLPTLVYMAREKRPNFPHHFKAGAMNALIRVSSKISNGAIILNLDCDMYPNSADTIQEALCFFLDETRGPQIAYVQFPQSFNNITNNDLYSNAFPVIMQLSGLCGNGGSIYCGTGCFHRRESLSGMHFKDYYNKAKWDTTTKPKTQDKRTADELIEASKALAGCTYEQGTQWGKEMGLVYGMPAEDAVTGLVISCRGWTSIYYNPERKAFLGLAPTTFDVLLVQHKRWGHGLSQIFFSKFCPFIYGHKKLSLGLQMGYSVYTLWAPISLPILCYLILLPISTFRGIPLFPQLTSPWMVPFLYAFVANNAYSFFEALRCGSTAKAWWNTQRMTMFRRTTSYLFGFIDTISMNLNLSQTKFDVTDKASSQETLDFYEREVLYFGRSSSVMFTIIATLALLNLFGAVSGIKMLLLDEGSYWSHLGLQIVLCVLIVVLNKPVYEALFIRTDSGSLPLQVLFKSIALASLACFLAPLIC